MACRKNIATMPLNERNNFINAVVQLKANGDYDKYVDIHQSARNHGHSNSAFFSWHREFLRRFEEELRAIDSSVSLPYWNWTVENLNSAGTASMIWNNQVMGDNGNVTEGPFSSWGIRRRTFDIFQSAGGGGDITTAMSSSNYLSFRPGIEGPHGGAHVWVGGDMGAARTAVRDPIFFLLHCNVDRLWSEWINQHAATAGFEPYLPIADGTTTQGHNLNDSMWPWNGTTAPVGIAPWTTSSENVAAVDLLNHRDLGYYYDTIDPECATKSVIKDISDGRVKFKDTTPEVFKRQIKDTKEIWKDRLPDKIPDNGGTKGWIGDNKRIDDVKLDKNFSERFDRLNPDIRTNVSTAGNQPFIRREMRPDLSTSALSHESDALEREDIQARLELRSKTASDNKIAKDIEN